ncbi:MAG: sigma-70 family RNA polymerase sigma factor, partial [Thermoanaerobaculia bacterium]
KASSFEVRGRKDDDVMAEDELRASRDADRNHEHEVLRAVRAGDTESFEYFVRTYQKRVYRLAYSLLRDSSDADCVTQDVFIKAFKALGDFKEDSAFETWITRIAINTVRDRVRRRKPVVSFSQLTGGDEADGSGLPRGIDPADGTSPERDMMSRDIRRRIAEAMLDLSPRQRAVFMMKHYEEKSISEIGAAIGLDDGTIKSHLFRAARKLRARLEDLR